MNTRPLKTPGWKTPAEVLDQLLVGQYDAGAATTGLIRLGCRGHYDGPARYGGQGVDHRYVSTS